MVTRHQTPHRVGTKNLVPIGELVNTFLVSAAKSYPYAEIGARIQDARRDKTRSGGGVRITQQRLADAIGVHVGTVTAWEIGKQRPDGKRLQQLADYLGVSASFLVTGEERPEDAMGPPEEADDRPAVGPATVAEFEGTIRAFVGRSSTMDPDIRIRRIRDALESQKKAYGVLGNDPPDWIFRLEKDLESGKL